MTQSRPEIAVGVNDGSRAENIIKTEISIAVEVVILKIRKHKSQEILDSIHIDDVVVSTVMAAKKSKAFQIAVGIVCTAQEAEVDFVIINPTRAEY